MKRKKNKDDSKIQMMKRMERRKILGKKRCAEYVERKKKHDSI